MELDSHTEDLSCPSCRRFTRSNPWITICHSGSKRNTASQGSELNESNIRLDGLSLIEINEMRPFVLKVMNKLRQLHDTKATEGEMNNDDDGQYSDVESWDPNSTVGPIVYFAPEHHFHPRIHFVLDSMLSHLCWWANYVIWTVNLSPISKTMNWPHRLNEISYYRYWNPLRQNEKRKITFRSTRTNSISTTVNRAQERLFPTHSGNFS